MRQRVDSGAGGDTRRLRDGERRIEDRDFRRGLRIAARHLLMRLFVGNQRERLALAARAGGRRNGDEREHRIRRLADSPVVLHPSAIGQDEVAALRRIHAAAAAEADDQFDRFALRDLDTAIDIDRRRILPHRVEHRNLQTSGFEKSHGPARVPDRGDAFVGDEQNAAPPKSRANSPTRSRVSWPKTTRVRGWKSKPVECIQTRSIERRL